MAKTQYDWLINQLSENVSVSETELLNDKVLRVIRTNGEDITVLRLADDTISYFSVRNVLQEQNVDFVLHAKRDAFIESDVFDYMEENSKIIGSHSDLFSVIDQGFNWPYIPRNVGFILRGVGQHDKVRKIRRLDTCRYEITRTFGDPLIMIALYEYDLGIEAVRSALEKYKDFDIILKGNPNGEISTSAMYFTGEKNFKIYFFRELLAALNKKWENM